MSKKGWAITIGTILLFLLLPKSVQTILVIPLFIVTGIICLPFILAIGGIIMMFLISMTIFIFSLISDAFSDGI